MRLHRALLLSLCARSMHAQDTPAYAPLNQYSVFIEYANDSSHILLGVSQNRRLAALGATYSRRILRTHSLDWRYQIELRPLAYIQDPIVRFTFVPSPSNNPAAVSQSLEDLIQRAADCTPQTRTLAPNPAAGTPGGVITRTCGTRWTYSGGLSPLGQQVNFLPRRRLQPFIVGNAGLLASTRVLPSDAASRFNFTFELGAGLQLFSRPTRSVAVEYRFHHLSNARTADENPGIDSQIVKVTYSFGR